MSRRQRARYNRNSPFASKQSGSGGTWLPEMASMRTWCQGKWWFPRLVFLLWFGYLGVNMFWDPNYQVIFWGLNLGIHELGHYLWMPFGEFMMFLGGSASQCLAPIISMGMFYRQGDYFAIAFCFGWLSTNLYSVARYVGDASTQAIPLVTPGGGEPRHDWHYLLGRIGLLNADSFLAMMTRGLGALSMLTFLVVGGYQVWLMFRLPKERELPGFDDEDLV